jgi:hypothetical protein
LNTQSTSKTNKIDRTTAAHPTALVTLLFVLTAGTSLFAQVSAPPTPKELTSAHTIFITNAADSTVGVVQTAYADFYASLIKRYHFQQGNEPLDSSVVVRFTMHPSGILAWSTPLLQADALDPKTQTVLWSATEVADNLTTVQSVSNKILAHTSDQLAEDFAAVVQQRKRIRLQDTPKTRFSLEK